MFVLYCFDVYVLWYCLFFIIVFEYGMCLDNVFIYRELNNVYGEFSVEEFIISWRFKFGIENIFYGRLLWMGKWFE